MSEVQSAGLKSKLEKVTGKMIRLRLRDIVHVLYTIALLQSEKTYHYRQQDAYPLVNSLGNF